MIFQDAIVEFGFDCKVRKLSPRSIDNYQKQLRYLQNYLLEEYGIKNVEQVKTAHIKLFLAMMDDRQRKPRYINDLLKAFKTFFNYLKREGHIKILSATCGRSTTESTTTAIPWFPMLSRWIT